MTDPIQQQIDATATAPRVTPADLEAEIASEHYFTAADGAAQAQGKVDNGWPKVPETLHLLTFCVLVLKNGIKVVGDSACVSKKNFNAEIGRKLAREKAIDQLWPLLGFRLADRLHGRLDRIARVAHEVNRAYCESLGDNSQLPWEEAPEWQRVSARMGVDLHLMGDFGPEASHIAWMQQKLDDGWVYGEVKDPEAKTHPCLVPFEKLPLEQQAKDYLFRGVVHAMR